MSDTSRRIAFRASRWILPAVVIGAAAVLFALAAEQQDAEKGAAQPEAAEPVPAPVKPAAEVETWEKPRFKERQRERNKMVATIKGYGLEDEDVLKAMSAVPRHEFVSDRFASSAYADTPLPIGHGQTISQPYIVAKMTKELRLKPDSRVLEIGTGSGYQAAVLTEFTPNVYTIEIIQELHKSATGRLKRLGYKPVETKRADGYYGWPEKAPFDGIIVTCAAGQIPPPLIKQLKRGGRMVIPVGGPMATQSLMLVEKDKEGRIHSQSLLYVRFVPLVREKKE